MNLRKTLQSILKIINFENFDKTMKAFDKGITKFSKEMKEFDKMMSAFSSGTGGNNKRQNQKNIDSIIGELGKSKNKTKIWSDNPKSRTKKSESVKNQKNIDKIFGSKKQKIWSDKKSKESLF